MIRNAALFLAGATLVSTLLAAAPVRTSDAVAGMPPGPAFELVVTAVPSDDLGPCGTASHVVVAPDENVLFSAIITNTGSEALTSHVRTDSTVPGSTGTNEIVEPGASIMMTWVLSSPVSEFHEVTWVAAGVDSGTEVARVGYAYVTIDGTQSQLDMTVMVDDGQETCGTASEIAVPAGTQVRVCYTMTNPFAFALVHHVLIDEHVGAFLIGFGPDLAPGESFVRTDVAVIDETTTWVGYWRAQAELDDEEVKVLYQDVDSVTIEVLEPDMPATTTTTTTVPCVAVTVPDRTTTVPVVTQPPTTTPVTTEPPTTTTMSTSTSTTTTTTPSFTTTTSTTSPVLVSPTTATTLGEPAGFAAAGHAGEHRVRLRHVAAAPCPDTPPGGEQRPGGSLPATGTAVPVIALAAALVVAAGSVLLLMSASRADRSC